MHTASVAHMAAEAKPAICDHSRRLAEQRDAGLTLADRLANRSGGVPPRPQAVSTDVLEATHTPAINAKSEKLAHDLMERQWLDSGTRTVEDRLIASIVPRQEPVVAEQRPTINRESERIFARSGRGTELSVPLRMLGTKARILTKAEADAASRAGQRRAT